MCVQKQDRTRRFCVYSLYYSGTGNGNGTGTGYSGFSYGLSCGLSGGRKKQLTFLRKWNIIILAKKSDYVFHNATSLLLEVRQHLYNITALCDFPQLFDK